MYELLFIWWDEMKEQESFKNDEVSKKTFLNFALKNKIILDEKELDSLFKETCGGTIDDSGTELGNRLKIRKTEFLRIFMRPCFKGALQNLYDFIEKHSIIIKNMPISIKALFYQRQLLFAGIESISDANKNKQGLDGKIVLKALQEISEQEATRKAKFGVTNK